MLCGFADAKTEYLSVYILTLKNDVLLRNLSAAQKLIHKLKNEIKKSFSSTIDFFKVLHYNKLIE